MDAGGPTTGHAVAQVRDDEGLGQSGNVQIQRHRHIRGNQKRLQRLELKRKGRSKQLLDQKTGWRFDLLKAQPWETMGLMMVLAEDRGKKKKTNNKTPQHGHRQCAMKMSRRQSE